MDFEKKVNKNKVADHDEDVHDDASEEEVRIGKGETKAVNALKLFVVVLLVIVAGGVSGTVYHFGREHENEIFRSDFQDHAVKVIESFKHNSFRRKEALDSLAGEIELFAKTTGSEWPNIVMPDFEKRAAFAVLLSNVMSITFMPFVHSDKLAAWESFSVQHQDWLPRSLSKQGHVTADNDEENLQVLYDLVGENEVSIPPHVYSLEEPEMHVRHQANLYLPWWQFYPAFPVSNIVNTDLYTDSTMTEGFNAFFDAGTCITGAAWDASSAQGMRPAVLNLFLNRLTYPGVKSYTYEAGPISDIYVSVKDGEGDARGLVGALTASIYWQVYFENVLPDNARGVIARLENSCGQAYTFEINGAAATYLGEGDLHNPAYDDMAVSTGMGAFLGKYEDPATLHPGHCIYGVTVYPSSTMENIYRTREPVQFTLILISTFGVTCLVFLLYDCVVEKRQKVVMKTAVRSTKVVQSLFPAVVRERLYEGDATHSGTDAVSETFLDPEMTERSSDSSNSMADDGGFAKSTAIADLYPNCTVLFADIAGFTAWSAGRQPTEVFRLLETIYGVFDKIAKRRGVFKIETMYVKEWQSPSVRDRFHTFEVASA